MCFIGLSFASDSEQDIVLNGFGNGGVGNAAREMALKVCMIL